MLSSQLTRMILDGSAGSEDEMSATPGDDGGYGGDGLLDDIVAALVDVSGVESGRRPGRSSSAD